MPSPQDDNPADLDEMMDSDRTSVSYSERRVFTQPLDLSVQTLCDQWDEKLLILPTIQREYVWDNGKASRLIESLLLNIPIPVLYFAETDEAKYEIFDGHQRTNSIVRFIKNEFPLAGLSILKEHNGKRFFELPEREQRFLRMRTLRVILISSESHPNMKFEIYERLNTGSILLNAQELRNSIYRGPLNDLLHGLVRGTVFRFLLGTKSPRPRMVDEEMVLRFFAMREGLSMYRPSLKRFLNDYSETMKSMSKDDVISYTQIFTRTASFIKQILGQDAFRVLKADGTRAENAPNRALFEAQMISFSWIADDQATQFGPDMKLRIASIFADSDFMDSIQRATGDRSRTLRRVRECVAALRAAGLTVDTPFDLAN
jgi:hypothetical protein